MPGLPPLSVFRTSGLLLLLLCSHSCDSNVDETESDVPDTHEERDESAEPDLADRGEVEATDSAPPVPKYPESPCLAAGENEGWHATLMLLDELATLIPGFEARERPPDCMTGVWSANDPEAAEIEERLQQDFRSTERERRRAWIASLPKNSTWFRAFVPGTSRVRVGRGRVAVDEEPALTSVLRKRQDDRLMQPQHCLVVGAVARGNETGLWCGEPQDTDDTARFYVSIEGGADARKRLGKLARGDVVRFNEYLSLQRLYRPGTASARHWLFDSVPQDALSVQHQSNCCQR